mgnify:CR=1 FL=1
MNPLYKAALALAMAVPALTMQPAQAAAPTAAVEHFACPPLVLDLETGRLNGVSPIASKAEAKAAFPCFTGESTEAGGANYGGGVFYLHNDFYFYTWRRFLEVREEFSGSVTHSLLGKSRAEVAGHYRPLACQRGGNEQTRPRWACGEGIAVHHAATEFFAMPWGCLAIRFREDRASEIFIFPELQQDPMLAAGCTLLVEPI